MTFLDWKKLVKKAAGDKGVSLARTFFGFGEIPLRLYRRAVSALAWRIKAGRLSRSPGGLRLHLGCGDQRLPGMLNCEYRATRAADVIMDCRDLGRFGDNSASLIFSHAFFEHLYRKQQLILLKDCRRVLGRKGVVLFLGLPDFKTIARAYLSRLPGRPGRGGHFDLFEVYRYTHGDPEMAPSHWLQQLHKSLFDREAVRDMLLAAGFVHWAIFNYTYPNEKIPLNLGFAAWKSEPEDRPAELRALLGGFRRYLADPEEPLAPENLMTNG